MGNTNHIYPASLQCCTPKIIKITELFSNVACFLRHSVLSIVLKMTLFILLSSIWLLLWEIAQFIWWIWKSKLFSSGQIMCVVECWFRIWPAVVRDRVRDTYMYFGGSLFATVAAAVSVSRSPRIMTMMMRNSWMVRAPLSALWLEATFFVTECEIVWN